MVRASFRTAANSYPDQGNRELPVTLDFTATATIYDDLFPEMSASQIEAIQSVYIDNSLNPSSLSITPLDTMATITARPFSQGFYPIISQGVLRYKAATAQGVSVRVVFSNSQKQYVVWGDTDNANLPLVNQANNVLALANANNNILVAAVANKFIKLYRGQFEVDGPAILLFTDGIAGNVLWTANLVQFGAINFPETLIPYFATAEGNALVINSNAAVNLYGGFSYVQS